MADGFRVRVMVPDVWDEIHVDVTPATAVGTLKTEALARTRITRPADGYLLKFRGAEVFDESATLAALGVPPGAPFIVMPRRRRPVR